MIKPLFAVLFGIAVATAPVPAVWAQDKPAVDVEALRAAAKADKRALVGSTLKLTDAEAKKFWPLHDEYQLKMDTLNRRTARLVEEVVAQTAPISDAHAKVLLKEALAIEDEEMRLRRGYQNRLVKVLPATKVMRYLQLENKLRAFQDYDIAKVMPLLQ
jgi:Spy/CpxP family protein refolding chaperone